MIQLHNIPNCKYCLVAAYLVAKAATPASPSAPLFLTTAGRPLSPVGVRALMRVARHARGAPPSAKVTVHSLRRSGAWAVTGEGIPRADVMSHGININQHGSKKSYPGSNCHSDICTYRPILADKDHTQA